MRRDGTGWDGEQATEVLVPDVDAEAEAETGDWPVAELYRVDPEAPTSTDEGAALVVSTPRAGRDPRRAFVDRGWPLLVLAVLAAVSIVALGAWLVAADGTSPASGPGQGGNAPPPRTDAESPPPPEGTRPPEVPEVVGLPLADARGELQKAGFRIRVVRRQSDGAAGTVLEQAPSAGTRLARDRVVTLVVARPRVDDVALVATPDVIGDRSSDASAELREAGLRVRTELEPSDRPEGTVLSQSPAPGMELARDSLVTLTVASAWRDGQKVVVVPDVADMSSARAREHLRAAGLRVTTRGVASSAPTGTVLGQTPRAGARVQEGTTVTLRVSTGPLEVDVPDVTGLNEAAARFELESAGFRVQVVEQPTDDSAEDGMVVSQSPSGGSSARENAVVTITVARFA